MKSPLVSICFPTFNASEYIEIVLDSIKNQIYENIQVVICDDKSNDETLALIEKYKGALDIKLRAAVPLETAIAFLHLKYFFNLFSKFSIIGP